MYCSLDLFLVLLLYMLHLCVLKNDGDLQCVSKKPDRYN